MSERALSLTSGESVACAAHASASAHSQPWLSIETHPADDRVLVVVSGDLDIDTDQILQSALRDALAGSLSGVDLDLGGVEFCDCSGLNVLLRMRRRALAEAKTVAIRTAGDSVERLLDLTRTRPLFAWTNEDTQYDDADQDLRIELLQLRQALQTRPVIDLARGVLMATFALSAEDAWKVLVTISQRTNTKLRHVAQDLVNSVNGDPLPEPQQQQLAAAVADRSTPSEPPLEARE
ncbi:ANTAR domain-containing protein [Streptomyces sp. R41]|uniref:ANTAR domain-containing protein n=1 Tax=Streptomyces sp. R41 TaxID=3238632 RepID=A0AB39RTW2_9ACTN